MIRIQNLDMEHQNFYQALPKYARMMTQGFIVEDISNVYAKPIDSYVLGKSKVDREYWACSLDNTNRQRLIDYINGLVDA